MKLPPFDAWTCGSRGRERADAAAHRARLLKLARALADEHGLDAMTMKDLARAAGVGQGTVYRKFPHKGALAQALLGESVMRLRARLESELDEHPAPADRFLELLVPFVLEHLPLLREIRRSHDGWPQELPLFRWEHATYSALLRAQYDSPRVSPERVARLVLANARPNQVGYRHEVEGVPADHIATELQGMARRLLT